MGVAEIPQPLSKYLFETRVPKLLGLIGSRHRNIALIVKLCVMVLSNGGYAGMPLTPTNTVYSLLNIIPVWEADFIQVSNTGFRNNNCRVTNRLEMATFRGFHFLYVQAPGSMCRGICYMSIPVTSQNNTVSHPDWFHKVALDGL